MNLKILFLPALRFSWFRKAYVEDLGATEIKINMTEYSQYLRSVVHIEGFGSGSPAKWNAEEDEVHTKDSADVLRKPRRESNQGRGKLLMAWAWKNV